MLLLGVYLYVRDAAAMLFWVWLGNTLLIMLKHRKELSSLLRRRSKRGEGQ
ncbi:hypothetical protein D3C85_1911820 [compost metagenome]